jgi:hypothetical protein
MQSIGVTVGCICSNNLCFKAWVSNPLSATLHYAARGHFVNDVCTTKITQYFRRLSIPLIGILSHAAHEQANKNGYSIFGHKMLDAGSLTFTVNPLAPSDLYGPYRTANPQTLHFKYLFNKYPY